MVGPGLAVWRFPGRSFSTSLNLGIPKVCPKHFHLKQRRCFLEVTKLRPPRTGGFTSYCDVTCYPHSWCEQKKSQLPDYHCQSLPLRVQSLKLRMVSWNLNTLSFGGDYTPLAHHLTRWARILRGHVHSRKLRCPLEKGSFWWKDSKFLRGDILYN